MAERIELGGAYENADGEESFKYWVDVSSSLMNRVNAIAIEESVAPGDVLADVVNGTRELDDPENDESDESDESDE